MVIKDIHMDILPLVEIVFSDIYNFDCTSKDNLKSFKNTSGHANI